MRLVPYNSADEHPPTKSAIYKNGMISPRSLLGHVVFPWISKLSLAKQQRLGVVNGPVAKRGVSFVAQTILPTTEGDFVVRAYRLNGAPHLEPVAIISGNIHGTTALPVRVHDQCFTSEVLGSLKCDCKSQLEWSKSYIKSVDGGVVIYLQQEGRGMGLANKIKAYKYASYPIIIPNPIFLSLQEHGLDTVDANLVLGFEGDTREYSAVPEILKDLGIESIQLITNNPRKIEMIRGLGVHVVARIPIVMTTNKHSSAYISTKSSRMGHLS